MRYREMQDLKGFKIPRAYVRNGGGGIAVM
jgi:hypothetical protein